MVPSVTELEPAGAIGDGVGASYISATGAIRDGGSLRPTGAIRGGVQNVMTELSI
jgi:hypothetical protein